MTSLLLLSADQMRAVETKAIAGGVSSASLMEKAGQAVARAAIQGWSNRPAVVVCGPGNNGGDGFVAARALADAGWPVRVAMLGEREKLPSDAKLMADLFPGEITPFSSDLLEGAGLVIDALFGTGLARSLEGPALKAVEAINANPAPVLAIDLPSGVNANNGMVMGSAVEASRTVTFFAKKAGHDLFPGRAHCGLVDIADIGIPPESLSAISPDTFENQPPLWARMFPRPDWSMHKYHRGHVFAVSGDRHHTGAARLSARAALRIGAGLVTLLAKKSAADILATHLTSVMLRVADNPQDIEDALAEKPQFGRVAIIGPAAGIGAATRENALASLRASSASIVDADAITSFADDPELLFRSLRENDVLTPHEGEFARLFSAADSLPPIDAVRKAARVAGCVVVMKGAGSIIAAPDGRTAINVNAPADLATAGSGDVLAGLIAGLAAQGMAGFESACAAVWLHGAAGQAVGPGLIAEDLPEAIPGILKALFTPAQDKPQTA